jgi:hypothetical protein
MPLLPPVAIVDMHDQHLANDDDPFFDNFRMPTNWKPSGEKHVL